MKENGTLKLTLHMVSSLDGRIAKKDNSVSWFESKDHYENGAVEENPEEFLRQVDCFIMGAKTYEHAYELSRSYGWPYGEVPTLVITHRNLPIERKNVQTYSGDLTSLVQSLQSKYRNVWLVGGALLAGEFMRLGLVNEIRLSVLPVILGEGRHFFESVSEESLLHLKSVKAFKSGMVELGYEIKQLP